MKTIGFYTPDIPLLGSWDPDSVRTGIAGSEEAVIYAAQALARSGYRVLVFNQPPPHSIHSRPEANPRYLSQSDITVDIAIICRSPYLVKNVRARKMFLWPQDTWESPLAEWLIDAFDDVFWISRWQRDQWVEVNPRFARFSSIFGNGLTPETFGAISPRSNPHSCIYASNYGRGLSLLLDLWPEVKMQFPKCTLDIYYGWKHWGALTEAQESDLRRKLRELKTLDVREHGMVGHQEIAQAFGRASFWTYPCTKDETFCITAIKAQFAGAVPVILESSALTEVVQHGFKCSRKEDYLMTLLSALKNGETISLAEREKMGRFILEKFTWKQIVSQWPIR